MCSLRSDSDDRSRRQTNHQRRWQGLPARKPLRADVALLGASLADRSGNLVYKGTSQNFNPLMATAADLVIAEVRELVETGAIAPEAVRTPGIFVDYMVAPAK